MDLLKRLKQAGGTMKCETKKEWNLIKQQAPKAKESLRRTRVAINKFAKETKKAHAETRKTLSSFSDALPKIPDDYFEQFLGSPTKPETKKKKRKPKKKVVYYY